ncbi:hypothetical protein EMCRGX_G023733 [Ephydatia muelleri]
MADLLQQFERDEHFGGSRLKQQVINPFDEQEIAVEVAPKVQRAQQEYPIFRREDVTFSALQHQTPITHLAVSNGFVTVVTVGNVILRFNTASPRAVEQAEIKKDSDKIRRVFQDPLGHHLIVSMDSKECHYLGKGDKRVILSSSKLKGHIESVAWNLLDETERTTAPILLGTSNGIIAESEINLEALSGGLLSKKTIAVTEVHFITKDRTDHSEPITGLQAHPFPGNAAVACKYFVIASTPRRIYQFIGMVTRGSSPQFQDMFAFYEQPEINQFVEIPGSLRDSQLHLWPCKPKTTPRSLTWLTANGVYHCTLKFSDNQPGDSLLGGSVLIPYTVEAYADTAPVVGVSLSEFHCLLLYRDKVEATCVLNLKKVFDDQINVRRDGPLLGMCVDTINGVIYAHTKFKAFTYTPYKENRYTLVGVAWSYPSPHSRNIWRIYLDQGKYEQAIHFAEGNQEYLDRVLVCQADHYFSEKKYKEAAISFSQSQLSFEEVALKFLKAGEKDALKTFLLKKLETLGPKSSAQQTMLTTWLIEVYVNDLGNLRDEQRYDEHKTLQEEFHQFLASPALQDRLEENQKTIYDLLSSHGAVEDVVHFANLMKDYEKVIAHYIQQHRFEEALKSLTEKASEALQAPEGERARRFQRFSTLFYKFSPVLMQHCPQSTVKSWIKMDKYLEPKRLIPALVQCSGDPEQVSCATRYLEYCVNTLKNTDKAIHNFLISCYAKSGESLHCDKLLAYFVSQATSKTVVYDAHYALRLCLEHHLNEACVHIYSAMGLYEEALDLALVLAKVELAKDIANLPSQNKDLQKTLWLKIAKHVIEKQRDIDQAMKFMEESSLLKVEDILPLLSDDTTIDHFKDAICRSLNDYNVHIVELKTEMQGASESAKNIHTDILEVRHRCSIVHSDTKCQLCNTTLLSHDFCVFPCRHAYHKDCLIGELKQILPEPRKSQLLTILNRPQELENDKTKLDALVESECIFCGELMIETIDKPLVMADSAEDSWK